ncbi:MAG: UDP-N-acetylglucosamine--N-acetylmuramyl-(pentapeptide) pyrophosphoryl-undecaprenol N-acetylglucosamine transferase [Phycisphaeraceae bacterium]|nr:UDP-N-acetylglucosamine--N-acetylmuramyl-(pentapeptide) pyrophosphoryl-undecaprenol N-acetylglucosamine transferase [Phycisphaeraceae bacterium]
MSDAGSTEQTLRVIFAGGGTGGHLYPALAVAEQLAERNDRVESVFLCSARPLDARILSEESVQFVPIPARPFSLRPLALASFVRTWPGVVRRCRRQLDQESRRGRTIVVAMGGFVSAPVVAAAKKERIPVLLVNLDATPGLANKWVAQRCERVFTAAEVSGFPSWRRIRPIVRWAAIADGDRQFCRRELGLDPDLKTLLVTGASQGARTINRLMMALIEHRRSEFDGWQVIHQCGPVATTNDAWDEKAITGAYDKAGIRALVKPLFREMGRVWGAADLAIGRCGAGSVGEAWANRVPCLFLPYPYHKDQHQRLNALPLERVGGAIIAQDRIEVLANETDAGVTLLSLMSDGARRDAMREKLRELGPADGAGALADAILA